MLLDPEIRNSEEYIQTEARGSQGMPDRVKQQS